MITELLTFSNALADAVAAAAPAVVPVQGRRRPASGVVYSDNVVLTMARTLGREDRLNVRRHDGQTLEAEPRRRYRRANPVGAISCRRYNPGLMTYQSLRFEVADDIAWITLNRPEALNALNLGAVKELYDIANRCASDASIRAAVLTGAGDRAFCAGGDVVSFDAHGDAIGVMIREITGYLHLAISRFAWMRAPLVAAVNGVAAGGGFSLAMACDLVIAADTAKFTSVYTQIGFTPDGSSTYFLPRLIGRRRAMELYLTNRTLSAQEALDWGLVNRVVPAVDLARETKALAIQLAEGPTAAYGGIKKLMLASDTESLESQMERETRHIADAAGGADGREGVKAFVEKRKPRFSGE